MQNYKRVLAITTQSAQISRLTPRTKYFYQIVATDSSGNTATSPISSFRTGSK